MKNWKDKVLGIFAGIGLMSLLMANNNVQNENGRYQMTNVTEGTLQFIHLLDTRDGQVWRNRRGVWIETIEPLVY